ncbi:MAG: MBL fold metallo-hydrolase [Planctomycetes bacterium]|nr:MBL fold metallo-hydrolase [Planctomycetota bacterium]
MADIKRKHARNVPGGFFVDTTCIDCDTCRWVAPETFNDIGDQSVVYHQPQDDAARLRAAQALLACPTASIGQEKPDGALIRNAQASFPAPIADNVYFCGYTSQNSYGAAPYLIVRPDGNVLVDSPRFAAPLVKRLEEMGGVKWMFLTHQDDVADHAKFAAHFGCKRIMHVDDIHGGTSDVEMQIEGTEPVAIAPDLTVIPTPGHTQGSACLIHGKFLFTGDHLAFSPSRGHLYAFRGAMWYRWSVQIESMKRLRDYEFEWVLPGHGRRHHAATAAMRESLDKCIAWMEQPEVVNARGWAE